MYAFSLSNETVVCAPTSSASALLPSRFNRVSFYRRWIWFVSWFVTYISLIFILSVWLAHCVHCSGHISWFASRLLSMAAPSSISCTYSIIICRIFDRTYFVFSPTQTLVSLQNFAVFLVQLSFSIYIDLIACWSDWFICSSPRCSLPPRTTFLLS